MPETVCEMQTVQCVKQVCETVCRQVPVTTTVCEPVCVTRKVQECKTVCVPRTVTRQVPVEVCVRVPVCEPAAVLPSAQSVLATGQSQAPVVIPMAIETTDRRHPMLGRLFR